MSNLLSMGFYRIRKNSVFWISLILSAVIGVVFSVADIDFYDDMFIVPIPILIAAFVSLVCGREFSDGTIRNKIVCGQGKGKIYLASLILNDFVTLMIAIIFIAVHFVMRITAFRIDSVLSAKDWLLAAVTFALGCIFYTSLFTMISMLVTKREIGAIVNLGLVVATMFSSYQIEFQLSAPEYYEVVNMETVYLSQDSIDKINDGASYDGLLYKTEIRDDGEVVFYVEKETYSYQPNPKYVSSKPLRKFYEICDITLPHGQINTYMSYLTSGIRFSDDIEPKLDEGQIKKVSVMPFYSLAAVFVLSLLGFLLFRKKEIK